MFHREEYITQLRKGTKKPVLYFVVMAGESNFVQQIERIVDN